VFLAIIDEHKKAEGYSSKDLLHNEYLLSLFRKNILSKINTGDDRTTYFTPIARLFDA